MHYDFNAPVDRSNTCAVKWDERKQVFGRGDVLPLWIADMDLPTSQPIMNAIAQRALQGGFGYTTRPDSYFEAVKVWQKEHYGWDIDTALMSFSLGVVPALSGIVQEFSKPGDGVLFCSPVYPQFMGVAKSHERTPVVCPLVRSESGDEQGRYHIDFKAFEAALAQKPAVCIFCHPHNPVGRVWTRQELERVGSLCLQYGVLLLSDEIHADIMLFGHTHLPMAAISPAIAANTISLISATKTFNLAGLQASTTVFPNATSKARFDTLWNKLDLNRNNCFSVVAVEAAYRHGGEWLEQVLRHFERNMRFVCEAIEGIEGITVRLPEATYLMWLDCRGLGLTPDELADFMSNKARLGLGDGRGFGKTDGAGFMRLNVACPLGVLEEAMKRLKAAVEALR